MPATATREPSERLLKIADILDIVPISRVTVWEWTRTGKFPAPIKLGRRNYWRQSEVFEWLLALQSQGSELTKPMLEQAG